MDALLLEAFRGEILRQCKFARIAFGDMVEALRAIESMPPSSAAADYDIHKDRFWCSIQSALVALGNLSKLFWPVKEKDKARGEELRKAFDVDDSSPLKSRAIRNAFEHFDERIETWFKATGGVGQFDSNIVWGPIDPLAAGVAVENQLRNYDVVGRTLHFLGDTYRFKEVYEALLRLRSKVAE